MMKRLWSLLVALTIACAFFITAPTKAVAAPNPGTPSSWGCSFDKGGSMWSLSGTWVRVVCAGSGMNNKEYRAYASCDRPLWQKDRPAYGKRVTRGKPSTARCDAIGDMNINAYNVFVRTRK